MKVIRVLKIILILMVPCFCYAVDMQKSKIGAGIMIGDPTGINAKYWFNPYTAVDAGFSVLSKNEVYLHMTYLWQNYHAFPKPEVGKLPFYYGAGVILSSEERGIRTAAGIDYIFDGYPFDIFVELAPLLILNPDVDLHFTGLLGVRFYWK